jgi:hypothetical protein
VRPIVPVYLLATLGALAAFFVSVRPADAQEPPQPIPRYVIDLHGNIARFPADPGLAASRLLDPAELPGTGLGVDAAVHVYPFRYRGVTFGIGGRVTTTRAHRGAQAGDTSVLRTVTERFTYLGPQLSFNFGTASGWSYISGGIAGGKWSVVPDGSLPLPPDEERLRTIDYGGGARWFAKRHLAFSFDLRWYAINPSSPTAMLPGGPRKTLMVFGAGISVK